MHVNNIFYVQWLIIIPGQFERFKTKYKILECNQKVQSTKEQ